MDEVEAAFNIISQACASVQANLETHTALQRALGVVSARLFPTTEDVPSNNGVVDGVTN